ncbi:MAG: hypothetical protein JWN73_1855 [Betaproteobacteria bacterium]|nr:hypothetical protein [Betaproteobacteria bacterium]
MTPVRIDFSGARVPASGWALLLFAAGAAACIGTAWRVSNFSLDESRVMAEMARAQAAVNVRLPAPVAPVVIAEDRVTAINGAIAELNLPWQALFSSLERIKPNNIALLGLEPNGPKHLLRISAEAKQADDMLDFVRLLRQQPPFVDALLVKHEINTQDSNRPLRFSVEAVWKDDL